MTVSSSNPDQLPMPADDGGRILQIGPDRRLEAVRRLVDHDGRGDPGHAQRFLETAATMGISLDHLFARVDGSDRITATVLAVPSPGRTAMLFCNRIGVPGQIAGLAGVIAHTATNLDDGTISLAQALLDPSETLEEAAYLQGGFTELASLSYLERPIPTRRHAPRVEWPSDVALTTYEDTRRDDVIALLEATYVDTLDCPGLFGLRDPSDIFDGHQSSGEFDPSLWTLLFVKDALAGVLMLNPSSSSQSVELVYIGLAPSVRGRGLGSRLLRHGLARIAGRPERTMTLAVDEANSPAIQMYKREGFRRFLRRRALIRALAHNNTELSTER